MYLWKIVIYAPDNTEKMLITALCLATQLNNSNNENFMMENFRTFETVMFNNLVLH